MRKTLAIQKEVQKILGTEEVYLVGGSVRDFIMGNEPKDYDFTTSMLPEEMKKKVKAANRRVYTIGEKFGTIGFKVLCQEKISDDETFARYEYVEVTTFRSEVYTSKSRKPEVAFVTSLDEDLARRDFTINAIALKGTDLYDPYGGRLDILAKKIKAVGNGKDRIKEDPLRMLRAARFAARLDFEVDPNFIGVMRQNSSDILRVSKERWVIELDKILGSQNPSAGLEILMQTDVMKYILPEVWLAFQDPICKENTYKQLTLMAGDNEFTLNDKWGVLTYYIGFPYTMKVKKDGAVIFPGNREIRTELNIGLCQRLKFSNERTRDMLQVPVTEIKQL